MDHVLERGSMRTRDGVDLVTFMGGPRAAPVVLLVNAFETPIDLYALLARSLSERLRVLCAESRYVDAVPGRLSRSNLGLDAHAADVIEVLDHFSASEPVHVVGWCAGAHVAHRFARRNPTRVATITLLNIPCFHEQPALTDFQRGLATVVRQVAKGMPCAQAHHALMRAREAAAGGPAAAPGAPTDEDVARIAAWPQRSAASLFSYSTAVLDLVDDGEERHPNAGAHPCLVAGGRSDQVSHWEGSRSFARCYPGARCELLDGGHYQLVLDPEVARLVGSFIERHVAPARERPAG